MILILIKSNNIYQVELNLNLNVDKDSNFENQNLDFQASELIVAYIVDKLISFTITKSDMKEVEKKIGNHCFIFVREMLSNMVKMDSIAFDREDFNKDYQKLKEEESVFYDTIYEGVNDWSSINEPVNIYL